MNKQQVLFGVAAAFCLCASAVVKNTNNPIDFPDLQGNGDISADASWGEGGVPTEDCPFIVNAGEYFVNRDVAFAGFGARNFANNGTGTVVATGHKVTMAAHLDILQDHSLKFVGGTWDFQGKYGTVWNDWNEPQAKNVKVTLDGCVFDRMAVFSTGYYGNAGGVVWTFLNGAEMNVSGELRVGHDDPNGHCQLNILSGSRVVASSYSWIPEARSPQSGVRVSGKDSFFSTGDGMKFGSSGNFIRIEDGASASLGGGWWYWQGRENTISVSGEGSALSMGPIQQMDETAVSNRLEVLDNASMTFPKISLGATEAFSIVVSNATAKAPIEWDFAGAGAKHCSIGVQGESAKLEMATGFVLGGTDANMTVFDGASLALNGDWTLNGNSNAFVAKGIGTQVKVAASTHISGLSNSIEVKDGATLTMDDGYYYSIGGTNNVVSVRGAGSQMTLVSADFSGLSNRYEAVDGAIMNTTRRIYPGTAEGLGLAVSNGTINVNGFGQRGDATPQGIHLRFAGDHPLINAYSDGLYLGHGMKLIYELPLDGYVEDGVPLQYNSWTDGDETAWIEIENVDRLKEYMRANGIRKRVYRLIRAPGGIGYGSTPAMAVALGRNLPEDCSLSVDGQDIVLTVKAHFGMIMTVR